MPRRTRDAEEDGAEEMVEVEYEGEDDEEDQPGQTFGLEVKPGVPELVTLKEGQVLLITSACLGERVKKDERAVLKLDLGDEEVTVCSLVPFVQENVQLDLPIAKRSVTFSVACAKNTNVHLLGRFVTDYEDEDGEDGEDGPEQAYASFMRPMFGDGGEEEDSSDDEDFDPEDMNGAEGSSGDDDDEDDDEDDDDEDDEDEEIKKLNAKFPGRTRVEIKELPDDDVDDDEEEEEEDDEDDVPTKGSSSEKAKKKGSEKKQKATNGESNGDALRKRGRESIGSAAPSSSKKPKGGDAASPAKTTPSKTKSEAKDSKSPGKPSEKQVKDTVLGWLKKEGGSLLMSDLGNRLTREYGASFKSLGLGALKSFLQSIDGASLNSGKVTLD